MLKNLEKRIRHFRDRKIIKPIMLSRFVQKHSGKAYDAAVLDFGDHSFAFDPADRVIGATIKREGGWFRDETMRIFKTLSKRGVFVDVGANIGTQTIYALKFGGFDRAVCFEPAPKNAWLLRTNLALNGLSDRAVVIQAAAGSEAGTASLFFDDLNSGRHGFGVDYGAGSVTVDVVTVDDTLSQLGISPAQVGLAWVDAEGHEVEVLKGWPSLPGTQLCMEYTPNVRPVPPDMFAGWKQWADVREIPSRWRPISDLDFASYSGQVDLLFT